jgi:hypothetical protein
MSPSANESSVSRIFKLKFQIIMIKLGNAI